MAPNDVPHTHSSLECIPQDVSTGTTFYGLYLLTKNELTCLIFKGGQKEPHLYFHWEVPNVFLFLKLQNWPMMKTKKLTLAQINIHLD